MSLQYGEADATATPRKLSSYWHTYTAAYPPHVRKHAYSYIHTMHTAIFIKEKKTKMSSQQPGTWSHPCTPLLLMALDGERQGSGRTGRGQDLRGARGSPRSKQSKGQGRGCPPRLSPGPCWAPSNEPLSRMFPTLLRLFCPAAPSITSPHPSPPGTSCPHLQIHTSPVLRAHLPGPGEP